MIPRILKIKKVEGARIFAVFNSGEYRVIDLIDFAEAYGLSDEATLKEIIAQDSLNVVVENGTLTFPDVMKTISLESGKNFQVKFDLDPVMLYNVSKEDTETSKLYQIGSQLKTARKQAGLTQEQLAERVGTSKSYISRIENDRTDIALKTLRRIVEVGLGKRVGIID